MPIVIPIAGAIEMLSTLLKSALTVDIPLQVGLYTNTALVLTRATQTSDFEEADFTGYSRVTLTRSSWEDPEADADDRAICNYAGSPVEFTLGADETVVLYGYFVVSLVTDSTWWAEEFVDPITLTTTGQSILLELPFTFTSVDPPLV